MMGTLKARAESKWPGRRWCAAAMGVALCVSMSGIACVRRTMIITTEPPNARVFLNDEEIGRSEVSTDFLWYGDYGVIIRKEGYETLQTHWLIEPPWYEVIPIDFLAEVLWPGRLHDVHKRHFELKPYEPPGAEELVSRAVELRARALDARK